MFSSTSCSREQGLDVGDAKLLVGERVLHPPQLRLHDVDVGVDRPRLLAEALQAFPQFLELVQAAFVVRILCDLLLEGLKRVQLAIGFS